MKALGEPVIVSLKFLFISVTDPNSIIVYVGNLEGN